MTVARGGREVTLPIAHPCREFAAFVALGEVALPGRPHSLPPGGEVVVTVRPVPGSALAG